MTLKLGIFRPFFFLSAHTTHRAPRYVLRPLRTVHRGHFATLSKSTVAKWSNLANCQNLTSLKSNVKSVKQFVIIVTKMEGDGNNDPPKSRHAIYRELKRVSSIFSKLYPIYIEVRIAINLLHFSTNFIEKRSNISQTQCS